MDTIVLNKKEFVLVPVAEYRKLKAGASDAPPLPRADARGNRPAVAFADASIAQSIVRHRKTAGLSQRELAELAGIRVEVLNRAERGTVVPSVRTLMKIETGLKRASTRRRPARSRASLG
jgi:ribosome-binding protein aMBF1 (putative translation factor)